MALCFTPVILLPLDRPRRLAGDVVGHAVDAAHFVDDAVGDVAEEGVVLIFLELLESRIYRHSLFQ